MLRFNTQVVSMIACALISVAARADGVVLEPNNISGDITLHSSVPEIQAVFDSDGLYQFDVSAISVTPAGLNAFTPVIPVTAGHRAGPVSFSLQAESHGGVTYKIVPTGWTYPLDGNGQYYFQNNPTVLLQPPGVQPGGVSGLHIVECPGLTRLKFVDASNPSSWLGIDSGHIFTSVGFNYLGAIPSGHYSYLFIPDGATAAGVLYYSYNGVFHRADFTLTGACDQIQDIVIPVPTAATDFGGLQGPFQVFGIPAASYPSGAMYVSFGDAAGNVGSHVFANNPAEAPVALPGTWWHLDHLPVGDWTGYGSTILGSGYGLNWIRTNLVGTSYACGTELVTGGTTNDMHFTRSDSTIGYPFAMHPGFFEGDVRLADPYLATHPGAPSTLTALFRNPDIGADAFGNPLYPYYASGFRSQTVIDAVDTHNFLGESDATFAGSFNAAAGVWTGTYSQAIPLACDAPWTYQQRSFSAGFYSLGTASSYYFDGTALDPATYRNGYDDIAFDTSSHSFSPGDHVVIPHHYCFNEVEILYTTTRGTMYNPTANITGGFTGTDFEGHPTHYTVAGAFSGTPATGVYNPPPSNASASGLVQLTLPQGSYDLQPSAHLIAPDGSLSTATFLSTHVDVGCGDRLTSVPGFSVGASAASPTTAASEAATVTVSSTLPAGRVWYSLNSAATVDLCSSTAACGIGPTFTPTIALACGANSFEAFAFSPDLGATVSHSITITRNCDTTPPSCSLTAVLPGPPKQLKITVQDSDGGLQSIEVTTAINMIRARHLPKDK